MKIPRYFNSYIDNVLEGIEQDRKAGRLNYWRREGDTIEKLRRELKHAFTKGENTSCPLTLLEATDEAISLIYRAAAIGQISIKTPGIWNPA